jgi:hypothetical protein
VGDNTRSSDTRLRTNEVVEATAISTMDGTPRHERRAIRGSVWNFIWVRLYDRVTPNFGLTCEPSF